LLILLMGIIRH